LLLICSPNYRGTGNRQVDITIEIAIKHEGQQQKRELLQTILPSEKIHNYRIIEWPGLKRTTVIIELQPPAMCRVANHQTRLPRATSCLDVNWMSFRTKKPLLMELPTGLLSCCEGGSVGTPKGTVHLNECGHISYAYASWSP